MYLLTKGYIWMFVFPSQPEMVGYAFIPKPGTQKLSMYTMDEENRIWYLIENISSREVRDMIVKGAINFLTKALSAK